MEPFHLGFTVQQKALLLDAEGGEGIVVIEDGGVTVHRRGEDRFIGAHFVEKALHLIKTAAGDVVGVQNAVTELLRALGGPPVAEVQQPLAAVGHALPAPQLGLIGPGQKAGDVVALCAHDGLGDPEVFPLQTADIVQTKGDLTGRKGFFLPAPHRVVVVRHPVQRPSQGGIVGVLAQTAAGKVVHDHSAGDDFTQQLRLEPGKGAELFAAKPLPIQPEGGIMGGDGGGGQGNLVKIVILLAPEGSAVGLIEGADVPAEFFPEELLEGGAAPGAPALIAPLMAQFIVDLPGDDGRFPFIMLCQTGDDLCAVGAIGLMAVTGHMASAKGPGRAVFKLGKDVGILMDEPGRRSGGRGAEDDLQSLCLCHGDHAVKVGKIEPPFLRLHPVPGKLADADHIASQLQNAVHVGLHPGALPLFRVIVDA